MVARGAIGNPWLFRELLTGDATPPAHDAVCAMVEEHIRGMVRHYGEEVGLRNARKIILAYLCGRGYRRSRRNAMSQVTTLAEFDRLMTVLRDEGPSSHFDPAHDLPAFRRNQRGFTSRWRLAS
jgi:tRNA-dihydrouridine synthase